MKELQSKPAESLAELERIAELNKRIFEKEVQLAQLIVRAPQRGHVIGRNLDALLGRYLREGEQILILGDEFRKQLQLSVSQDDLAMFAAGIGQEFKIRVPGQAAMRAPLTTLQPQAGLQPKHLALCAIGGGPIPV